MKYYVIINGVSSETIQGLAIESLPAISKPLQRSRQETIDGRDGDIITKLGYSAYDKTLKIGLWGNYDINEVIKYFDTEGTITFSNEPDMYYNFNILNRIDFINQLEAFRKATITIHCQPFKYKEEETETLELEEHQEEGTSFNLEGTYEAPMQIDLKGNTSQEGTPTPDYPQDIHNVSGNNNVVVYGKNVININGIYSTSSQSSLERSYENGIATLTWYSGFNFYMSQDNSENNFIPLPDSTKTYTFSFKHKGDALYLKFDESNTNILSTNVDSDYTTYSYTFSGLSEIKIKFIRKDTTGTAYLKDFQLEEGSTATTYEAYNGTTYPINLPSGMELSKIGTYQDKPFKAVNGDKFYDSLDNATKQTLTYDKWYLHKEVGKVVLDGSENWGISSNGSTGTYRFYISKPSNMLGQSILFFSNNFSNFTPTYTTQDNSMYAGGSNFIISRVLVNGSYIETTENFETWLSTHNTIVNYVLATATNTEITDTTLISQLEAIYNAKSKNGTTNINQVNNDLPFILDIDYFTGTNEITITNNGNTYSKPVLTLTGSGVIGIYLNDTQIFQVSLGTDETIIIDINNMEAYYDATLKNRQVIGDYNNFRLIAGENKIKLTGNWDKLSVDNYSRWI